MDVKVEVTPPEGVVVVGFVSVVEVVDQDGKRHLMRMANEGCESWQQRGYLSEALNGRLSVEGARTE